MPEWKPEILRQLAPLKLSPRREAEIADELAQHLEDHYQELTAAGHSQDSAFHTAIEELKDNDFLARGLRPVERELHREPAAWGGEKTGTRVFAGFLQDIRYAFRMLRKAPGFTAVALLTLALGIGANTAIFNLVEAVLLRPLPVSHPGQLALLTSPTAAGTAIRTSTGTRRLLAYSEYLSLRDHNHVFSGLLAADSQIRSQALAWNTPGQSTGIERAWTQMASGNFFTVLGVAAYRGRLFAADETATPGADPVVVMSYGYWTRRFGRNPGVVGGQVQIYGHPFTVLGVTPPGFTGITGSYYPDLWIPLTMQAEVLPGMDLLPSAPGVPKVMWLQAMGRLKPGVTLRNAQQDASLIFLRSLQQEAGAAADPSRRQQLLQQTLKVTTGRAGVSAFRDKSFSDPLLATLALVGLVLLLVTVNLAGLLLARAATRQKEMSIRLALGARRGLVVRQLLAESVMLSVAGGLLGMLLAIWGDRAFLAMIGPLDGGIGFNVMPDGRVLGFVAGTCVLTGILFGLAPALRMGRLDLNRALQVQGRGGTARSRTILGGLIRGGLPLGKVLVIAQMALSILLVVGAALFVRSFRNLTQAPLGFRAVHLTEFGLDLSPAGYQGEAAAALLRRFVGEAKALPGVLDVALTGNGLFENNGCGLPIGIDGVTPPPGHGSLEVGCDHVSADFFRTAGIFILRGRALDEQDQTGTVKSAVTSVVINQAMEERYFADRNPIGMRIRDLYPDDRGVVYRIVGVCADFKTNGVDEIVQPSLYLPFFNDPTSGVPTVGLVLVRETGASATVNAEMRGLVSQLDARLPPPILQSVSGGVADSLVVQDLLMRLSGFFGALALLLAAMGIYGVMAYSVARRIPEIGVRMALGADRAAIMGMILGETALLLGIGLAVGIPLSLAGAKAIASQIPLFGLRYDDPVSLAATAAMLGAVALLAGLLPALRASWVEPAECLRLE